MWKIAWLVVLAVLVGMVYGQDEETSSSTDSNINDTLSPTTEPIPTAASSNEVTTISDGFVIATPPTESSTTPHITDAPTQANPFEG
jgi:hypothetical protein